MKIEQNRGIHYIIARSRTCSRTKTKPLFGQRTMNWGEDKDFPELGLTMWKCIIFQNR